MGYRIRAAVAIVAAALILSSTASAQKISPSETVKSFYNLLREQHYAEGFAFSVYADAVTGLTPEEISELTPDFQAIATVIPAEIKIVDEKISGDTATVFADFGNGQAQPVELVKERGRWLIGDRESLKLVQREKTAFFFNTRIEVNQNAAYGIVKSILAAEDSYYQQTKLVGTLADLAQAKLIPEQLASGSTGGYKYMLVTGSGQKLYHVIGVPERYGRTGKLSFYGDAGGIHAADTGGSPADEKAPLMREQVQP